MLIDDSSLDSLNIREQAKQDTLLAVIKQSVPIDKPLTEELIHGKKCIYYFCNKYLYNLQTQIREVNMAVRKVSFQVAKYQIIARPKNKTIRCRDSYGKAIVDCFFDITVGVSGEALTNQFGKIFYEKSDFPHVVDLLRNEDPVSVYCYSDTDRNYSIGHLYSGNEEVGEGEDED